MAAVVVDLALKLARVEMAKSCASAASPTVRIVVAVSTSSSEKPRSAVHDDFAKTVHPDAPALSVAQERDRHWLTDRGPRVDLREIGMRDRKGTRLNSSH